MSSTAVTSFVQALNIGKIYRVYKKPVHRLHEIFLRRPKHEVFTALDQISFELSPGRSLGLIGENGAGKSTLLKILAGTLNPSHGQLHIQGRIAALLELGAGFHQEFTGRQNIYLNASIMGLTQAEIKSREEEIISFAELEEFIDRPIKTYSTGMVVRLAFSIATSVDPDVLIIDEALSVGDQRFQEKCVRRMQDFRQAQKTIVLCSHSMYLVNELCEQAIWLDKGQERGKGQTSEIISQYLAYLEEKNSQAEKSPDEIEHKEQGGLPEVTIQKIDLADASGHEVQLFQHLEPVVVRIWTKGRKSGAVGHILVGIETVDGKMVFVAGTKPSGLEAIQFDGEQVTKLYFPQICLQSGSYRIRAVIGDENALRQIDEQTSQSYAVQSPRPEFGMIHMEHEWL